MTMVQGEGQIGPGQAHLVASAANDAQVEGGVVGDG
jgi:hypothetical protein